MTTKPHVHVIAKITPKAEYFTDVVDTLDSILDQTRAESGCLRFDAFQDNESVFLVEEWTDQAALDYHYSMPYITPIFDKYENWLSQPIEIAKLNKLR